MKTVEQFEYEFNNAKRGSWISYHDGNLSDNIGLSKIGKYAMNLYDRRRAVLVQKRYQDEPRQYVYFAVKV